MNNLSLKSSKSSHHTITPVPGNPDTSPRTSHKLNGQIFFQWYQSVFMFICGRDKDGHLTGETVAPDSKDPKFRTWRTNDHLVMSWLINSMTTEVGENFMLYKTTREIWEAAKETYSRTENSSGLFELQTKLYDLRQGDLFITQYFHLFSRIWIHIDLFDIYPWKCADDATTYRTVVNQKENYQISTCPQQRLRWCLKSCHGNTPLTNSS